MQKLFGNQIVGLVFRVVLAAIMIYAGGIKLFEAHGARDAILAYRLLPISWAPVLGYALPLFEIAIGLCLLVGLFVRLASIATAVLMTAFIIGIASVWARGYSIDCGCFGGGGDVSASGRAWRYTQEIIRDSAFTLMAIWLYRFPRTKFSLEHN